MAKLEIVLEKGFHRDSDVIFLRFPYDYKLVSITKSLVGARFSKSNKSWYIALTDFDLTKVYEAFKGYWVDYSAISDIKKGEPQGRSNKTFAPNAEPSAGNESLIESFRTWLQHKRYSENTVRTYTEMLFMFARHLDRTSLREITNDDVVVFVHSKLVAEGYSFTYQNQLVSALKLFFREMVNSSIDIEKLERPRRQHKLPNVLSKEEVQAILSTPKNIKHRTMLSLIYACGLRRRELLSLRPNDIDRQRHMLTIRNAKGRKDRMVPVSDKVIGMVNEYQKRYKPTQWMFEGQKDGEQYSEQSLSKVLKIALAEGNITKPATLHWLRHS
jgi:integrase/recombinase XerD